MKDFSELVINRRSIRQFTEKLLSPEEIEIILKAALMSPSSKNSRPCRFVVVEEKETLQKLSVCKPTGAAFIEHCSLAIVVLSDPLKSEAHIEDVAIAATYIQLQAEDLGLGTCWVQIRGRETEAGEDSEQYVRNLLEIPLQLTVACIIALGHKAKIGKPHDVEKLQWEKVFIDKYVYEPIDE
ncbi:NAD(P)H nitroreductase [Bacteroidia bacterium]|nr:NAD(P)H nitroreductase [Bacteroidia bacterium]